MKIGAKVHYFNYEMRKRRKERGWTQARLGEESGVGINEVGRIERLLQPRTTIKGANDKLLKIARALELEFMVLFPAEYLALVERELLPRRRRPYLWVSELSLDQLPDTTPELLLPGPEVTVIQGQMGDTLGELVSELPPREARVLEMRFALNGADRLTLQEAGKVLGITTERVRSIEAMALKRLRHPVRSRKLDEYVDRAPRKTHAQKQAERDQREEHSQDAMEARVAVDVREERRARVRRRGPREVVVDRESRARAVARARVYQDGIRFRVPKKADVGARA